MPSRCLTVVILGLAVACGDDEPAARSGAPSFRAEPPVLLPLPGDRPQASLHGRLIVTAAAPFSAGSSIRVRQGYREHDRWLTGGALRYGLPEVGDAGEAAPGITAFRRGGPLERSNVLLPVHALPNEVGWIAVPLPDGLAAAEELVIELGDPRRPELGPWSSTLPIEVDLFAEIIAPDGSTVATLPDTVPVRVVDPHIDWLRVIVPAQAATGTRVTAHCLFMSGLSGPVRSSLDSLIPQGVLEIAGPFETLTVKLTGEPDPALPHAVLVELPELPAGLHRIRATLRGDTSISGISNPIEVGGGAEPTWFGSLHEHTIIGGHATSTPSRALRYARDVSALDFVALSEHREAPDFDGEWLRELALGESVAERFVVFTAFEWTDADAGHRHVVLREPIAPAAAPEGLVALARSFGRDPDALLIAHHSIWNGGQAQRNFVWGEPGELPRQRLAEVFSWHGSSLEFDSPFPLHGNHDQELPREWETDVLSALRHGHRLFLTADSDSHLGKPGNLVGIEWPKGRRYAFQGLTAVHAPRLVRDTIYRALDAGNVYGTTGARIVLHTRREPGRAVIEVHATAPLTSVTARTPTRAIDERSFADVAPSLSSEGARLYLDPTSGTWDATVEFPLPPSVAEEPIIVTVTQQDAHVAWQLLAPPIWSR